MWLPNELLHSIIDKLVPISDCIHFGLVCKQWHSVAVEHFQYKGRSHRQQLPLLMIPAANEERRCLYNVTEQKIYRHQLSVPYTARCCGSSHGWLITIDKTMMVSLLNPFSGAAIHLPPITEDFDIEDPPLLLDNVLYHYDNRDDDYCNDDDNNDVKVIDNDDDADEDAGYPYQVLKAVLSNDPDLYPDDYSVMVIYGSGTKLAFIKSGDKDWTYINDLKSFDDLIYHRGKFHALQFFGNVVSYDVNESPPKLNKTVCGFRNEPPGSKAYLVESPEGADLLLVYRLYHPHSVMTNGFSVLKAQVVNQGESRSKFKWVKTSTIGDVALFLGDNHSISVWASDFPGCQPNCIYFTDDYYNACYGTPRVDCNGMAPCDLGFFRLEDKSFGKHYSVQPCQDYIKRPPIWIVPKFNFN